jgi:hypothetical protein
LARSTSYDAPHYAVERRHAKKNKAMKYEEERREENNLGPT